MTVRTGSREVEGPDTSSPLQLKKLVKGILLTSGAGTRHASSSRRLAGYHIETTNDREYGSLSLALESTPSIVAAWFDELLDAETPTAALQLQGITYHEEKTALPGTFAWKQLQGITYHEGKTDHWALAVYDPASDVYHALPTFALAAVVAVEKQRNF